MTPHTQSSIVSEGEKFPEQIQMYLLLSLFPVHLTRSLVSRTMYRHMVGWPVNYKLQMVWKATAIA
jgi:hypothetical protein